MSEQQRPTSPVFTQVDITSGGQVPQSDTVNDEQVQLLRDILAALDRNNGLIEDLVGAIGTVQKHRVSELNQWKQANPELARRCRTAAESLSRVQVEYLSNMTDEITDSVDSLMEGEFMLNEFVDRFGPRLAHLNGVIQVLAQLSSVSNSTNSAPS